MGSFKRIVIPTPEILAKQAEEKRLAAERAERERIEREKAARDAAEREKERKKIEAERLREAKRLQDAQDKIDRLQQTRAAAAYKVLLYASSTGNAGDRGERKQWAGWTEGNDLVTEWGRVGSTLQQNRKQFSSAFAAKQALATLVDTKKLKGYK